MKITKQVTATLKLSESELERLWDICHAVSDYKDEPHAIYCYLTEKDVEFARQFCAEAPMTTRNAD